MQAITKLKQKPAMTRTQTTTIYFIIFVGNWQNMGVFPHWAVLNMATCISRPTVHPESKVKVKVRNNRPTLRGPQHYTHQHTLTSKWTITIDMMFSLHLHTLTDGIIYSLLFTYFSHESLNKKTLLRKLFWERSKFCYIHPLHQQWITPVKNHDIQQKVNSYTMLLLSLSSPSSSSSSSSASSACYENVHQCAIKTAWNTTRNNEPVAVCKKK